MRLILCLVLLATPALACSPSMDAVNRPYSAKLSATAFLGKVTHVTQPEWQKPGQVTFEVLASHGDPRVGTSVTEPYGDYGTCGRLGFAVGQTWVYSGDSPFGASMQPTAADFGEAPNQDFAALIKRIGQRLDPPPDAQDHAAEAVNLSPNQ